MSGQKRYTLHDLGCCLLSAKSSYCSMLIQVDICNIHKSWNWIHFKIQVNQALFDLIKASEVKMRPHDWTNLPKKESCKYSILKEIIFLALWNSAWAHTWHMQTVFCSLVGCQRVVVLAPSRDGPMLVGVGAHVCHLTFLSQQPYEVLPPIQGW